MVTTNTVCGLNLVDTTMLGVLFDAAALPEQMQPVQRLVEAGSENAGIPVGYGYDAIMRMAQPWRSVLRMVEGYGNIGSKADPPAEPRYVHAGLTPLGVEIVRAERGLRPPLPAGLIEGDVTEGGPRPHFHPERVVASLLLAAAGADTEKLHDAVGSPVHSSGCVMSGDVGRLLDGEPVMFGLRPHVVASGDRTLEVSCLPTNPPYEFHENVENELGRAMHDAGAEPPSETGHRVDGVFIEHYKFTFPDQQRRDGAVPTLATWPICYEVHLKLKDSWAALCNDWVRHFGEQHPNVDLGQAFQPLLDHYRIIGTGS